MASLDTLPADQRAVLDLVLQRGRSYDDIARLLAIDRAAVRARALAAFDELGPDTGIATEARALITDYLLGQLPERVAEQTRERLASSPYERAWARVLASELTPMASQPLPEIPDGSRASGSGVAGGAGAGTPTGQAAAPAGKAGAAEGESDGAQSGAAASSAGRSRTRERARRRPPRLSDRPSSRLGGAILLGLGSLIVVAIVVVLIVLLSGGSKPHTTSTPAASGTTPATTSPATTGSTTSPQAQVVAQNNLNPPSGSSSSAKGVGLVVKLGSAYGIVIEAQGVAPNSHNAYAAWLYNSPTDAYRLGFVNPAVGKSGRFEVGQSLPANAGHYKQLLVTLETTGSPTKPGTIVLQGPFTGVPAGA